MGTGGQAPAVISPANMYVVETSPTLSAGDSSHSSQLQAVTASRVVLLFT